MLVMKKLTVSPQAEKRIIKGIDLLESKDFQDLSLDDTWVQLYSSKGSFLALAYLSQQNKGVGWVVSRSQLAIDQEFFERLFIQAWSRRRAYHLVDHTTAYRIFNQDGDGLGGLTIDYYDGRVVFSWYNAFIYSLRDLILSAFREALPQIVSGYEKIRFKGLGFESQQLFGPTEPDTVIVRENGVCYEVFLNDGLMTGIFLDQHEVRGSLVNGLATGQRVLNMFSYTAAFSVAAAMGGALETTSVDLAKRSRELSQAHFQANGLDLENHRLVVMDVFEYFKYAKRHGLTYDLIVLDPPSFARNKKQTFSVAKDYHSLVSQSLELLPAGGILIVSTNAANLSLSKFKEQIEKGFGGREHIYLDTYRLPADFPTNKKDESSNYLKVFTIRA